MIRTLAALVLLLAAASPSRAQDADIRLTKKAGSIDVTLAGQPFTTYHFSPERAKPLLHPILGPGGARMLRDFPFRDDTPGEAHDHPHHEGLWYTHGDVNGISFWHTDKETGRIVHKAFLESAPDTIATANEWVDKDGKAQCSDETTIKFFALPDGGRGVDYRVTLRASHGDVTFGDTKEGSMGIRTNAALRLKGEVATGQALNARGDTGKALWGKPAAWVHYWGQIEDQTVGIAILDHPSNPRHPTTWHARDYGLIAANPFGASDFAKAPKGTGDLTLKSGDSITFRYAFLFLRGDAKTAKVPEHYKAWSK